MEYSPEQRWVAMRAMIHMAGSGDAGALADLVYTLVKKLGGSVVLTPDDVVAKGVAVLKMESRSDPLEVRLSIREAVQQGDDLKAVFGRPEDKH